MVVVSHSVNIEYTHCAKRNNITFKINLFLTLHRTRVKYICVKKKQTNKHMSACQSICVMIAIPLKFYICVYVKAQEL